MARFSAGSIRRLLRIAGRLVPDVSPGRLPSVVSGRETYGGPRQPAAGVAVLLVAPGRSGSVTREPWRGVWWVASAPRVPGARAPAVRSCAAARSDRPCRVAGGRGRSVPRSSIPHREAQNCPKVHDIAHNRARKVLARRSWWPSQEKRGRPPSSMPELILSAWSGTILRTESHLGVGPVPPSLPCQ